MKRSEYDAKAKIWTVPASRMKSRKEHRIPLSDEAIAIIEKQPQHPRILQPGSRDCKASAIAARSGDSQVKIDPAIPVPSWGLSEVGRTCTETLANTGWLSGTTQIISSGERKAIIVAIAGGTK